jgi:hypothetical protein|tara:strand:+ start:1231 stop:2235 length:1005 start_codon:yes stop_codon:yes gene_type:complete
MPHASRIKLFDCSADRVASPETCKTINQLLKEGYVLNQIPPYSGLYHTHVRNSEIEFKVAPIERVVKSGNAYIVFGSDRPDSIGSGYGAKGAQKAAIIDLVVGRAASVRKGKGAVPRSKVDNSFVSDAARIYISQLTDIDKNFGLAAGEHGAIRQYGCSAIGMKADAIRIIGREGIKIVTGKVLGLPGSPDGECNSRGGKTKRPSPPIELIAGNSVGTHQIPATPYSDAETIDLLQPIPLGTNVRDAFLELSDIVDTLWSALFNFALIQTGQNVSFGVSPFPWHAAAVAAATSPYLSSVLNSLYHTRVNKTMWEINYLNEFGYKYICSKSVKTT